MTSLYVRSIGMFTPVGFDAAQTIASIRTRIALFEPLDFIGSEGEPVAGARTDLEVEGAERLAALAAFALRECGAAAGPETPHPLLLCVADELGSAADSGLMARIAELAAVRVDLARSALVPGEGSGIVAALARAAELLAARRAETVYVGGVDSLISRARLELLFKRDHLLDETNPDGFVPSEGAGILAVSVRPQIGSVLVAGLGLSPATPATQAAAPVSPSAMAARSASVVRGALGQGRLAPGAVTTFVHTASGLRAMDLELAELAGRLGLGAVPIVPALSLGETGAAAGALCVGLLCDALKRHPAKNGAGLFLGLSPSGTRGAVLLRSTEGRA